MFIVLSSYLVYVVGKHGPRWFASPYNIRIRTQKSNIIAGSILIETELCGIQRFKQLAAL